MKEKIWLSPPHMGQNEILYIKEAFAENWIAPTGPNIRNFQDSLCNFTGSKFAVALNSGTSSLHLALQLCNVQEGDEVICSTFTFVASANPIIYQKATPVFVDSEVSSWNMDPGFLEVAIKDRINNGKVPKAIIVVHAYGNSARMDELMRVANKYNIPLIEDAAEALGGSFRKKALGTFGRIGIFSFNGNKIITTSSGGALITNEPDLALKAEYLASQARDKEGFFEHGQVGYNYKISNILAGVGLGQMKIIYERIKQRRAVFEYYYNNLTDLPAITFNPETADSYSNRWLTCITLDPAKTNLTPSQLKHALEKENIESRTLWKPLHLQPMFKHFPYYGNKLSEELFSIGLCLPSGSSLKTSDLDRVIEVIRKHIKV